MYLDEKSNSKDIKENIEKLNFKFDEDEKYIIYTEYVSNEKLKDILKNYMKSPEDIEGFGDNKIEFIKISDYNKIMNLKGEKETTLSEDEVLIASGFENKIKKISDFIKNEKTIILNGKEYKIANRDLITDSFYTI